MSVTFSDGSWRAGLREAALADLRAGLLNRHIATCSAAEAPNGKPLATINIRSNGAESVSVTVEIRDAVTDKRVTRDVALADIPVDGRSLAIALAADELVWASWAEVMLKESPRRDRAPRHLVLAVEGQLATARASSLRLGLRGSAEHYSRGLTQFGPDVTLAMPLAGLWRWGLGVGLRQGLDVHARDGRVDATALGLSLGISRRLVASPTAELSLGVEGRTAYYSFEGKANPSAQDHILSGIAVVLRAGPQASLRVSSALWLGCGFGVGVPLRSLEATDAGQVVTGVAGLELSSHLGIEGEL